MKLFAAAIFAQLATLSFAQAADILDQPLSNFRTFSGMEIEVCGKIGVPCGWEVADKDEFIVSTASVLKITGGTVREALDKIVERYPRYVWRLDDGVINFLPKPGESITRDGKPILDVIIIDLKLDGVRANMAVKQACEAAGLPCGAVGSAGGRKRHPKISLHLKNVTLRQALNAIVKKDGDAAWRFEFNKYGNNYVVLTWDWGRGKGPSLFK